MYLLKRNGSKVNKDVHEFIEWSTKSSEKSVLIPTERGKIYFPLRPKLDACPFQGNPSHPSPVVCLKIELTRDFACVHLYSCVERQRETERKVSCPTTHKDPEKA